MYTGPMCAFCDAAKRLFKRNNTSFEEIDIGNDLKIREEMIKKVMEEELFRKYL